MTGRTARVDGETPVALTEPQAKVLQLLVDRNGDIVKAGEITRSGYPGNANSFKDEINKLLGGQYVEGHRGPRGGLKLSAVAFDRD